MTRSDRLFDKMDKKIEALVNKANKGTKLTVDDIWNITDMACEAERARIAERLTNI